MPHESMMRHESMVRPGPSVPTTGWRARVFAATGGLVNPGVGATEQARLDLVRRARTPLHGPHRVAVTSIKGGIGKTTVAACLGLMLAGIRGDGVIAMDADPDAGTLADRISGPPRSSVRDLLADLDHITRVSELAAYTSLSGRLRVLAGDQDPAQGEAFRADEYERVQAVLARFFDIVVTDCGTGLVHSAMQGTLRTADRLVVVGAPTVDGASRAGKTLDWLIAHGHRSLADQAVLVLCADRTSHDVDRAAIREHFTHRCRDVVEIPADPHLRTGSLIDLDRLTPGAR